MRTIAKKVTLLILIVLGWEEAVGAPAQVENWYILSLGGKPVGYYHEEATRSDSGVNSVIRMTMRISRLGSETTLESKQNIKEGLQGNLLGVRSELLFSKEPSIQTAEIGQGVIRMTNEAAGTKSSAEIVYSGILSGNEGVRQLTLKTLRQIGDSVRYQVYLPDFGTVATGIRVFTGREQLDLGEGSIYAIRVKDTFEGLPTVRESWIDADGRLLKSSEPSPFGPMTMVLSSERAALAIAEMDIELSEDQYTSTIARSNVRLPQARELESVRVRISQNVPGFGLPDFSGSYQEVISQTDEQVVLSVRKPAPGELKEALAPSKRAEYLESGFFIDAADTLTVSLAGQIVGSETDDWKKTLLIRDWVNRSMKFNAGIAMAPSSEVARNLEGTCVSFATITTALCRAVGIPARYLMGMVYVDGMWGGHAWVEVHIQDSWIPVDAAMPGGSGVADAARFFFARTSVRNGLGETMIAGAQLYGNVAIEVLSYRVSGQEFSAASDLYHVTGEIYRNPGLGISMQKLPGFVFDSLDRVYPESVLFSMQNRQKGQVVALYQESVAPGRSLKAILSRYAGEVAVVEEKTWAGSSALLASTEQRAVMVVANGSDVWVLVSSGMSAGSTLRRAMENFAFTMRGGPIPLSRGDLNFLHGYIG